MNWRTVLAVLGVAFVLLKLTHTGDVAGWSWGWVLAPFWVPVLLAVVDFVVEVIVGVQRALRKPRKS